MSLMPVNSDQWKSRFQIFPKWLCPHCQSARLSLDKDTLRHAETGYSHDAKSEDPWEPDWIVETFTALLRCDDTACGEIVAIGGRTHHVEDHSEDEENWTREYQPFFLSPAPPVFAIPEECPSPVAEELKKAFQLLWSDSGSCANRLRAAVEALLTDRKIPRRQRTKAKLTRISLHSRIKKFEEKDADTAQYLLALKWLGNVGSHTDLDELSVDDLLKGFELFEHVIQLVYVKHSNKMKKIAKAINSRRGRPVRRRRTGHSVFD
jgi:hypothetical protein